MDEKLFQPIVEVNYLTAGNVWRYRAILRYFYIQYERLRHYLFPEEIPRLFNQERRIDLAKIMRAAEMEKCIGCYCCMLACARQVHSSLSLDRSGIHIRTLGGLTAGFQAVVCLACRPAPCAEACPTGAFRQRKGGGVRYSREACIHCGSCKEACPVDAIIMDRETGEPVVCYHCGRCVPFCPHSCLIMTEGKKPKGEVI